MFAGRERRLLIADASIIHDGVMSLYGHCAVTIGVSKEQARNEVSCLCYLNLEEITDAYFEDGMVCMRYDNGAIWYIWTEAKYFLPETIKHRVDSALTEAFNLC